CTNGWEESEKRTTSEASGMWKDTGRQPLIANQRRTSSKQPKPEGEERKYNLMMGGFLLTKKKQGKESDRRSQP
ncbi:hypothetical protein NDU88_005805, partial [Pleurodeles waltl]